MATQPVEEVDADLLIAGGTDSSTPAAAQAARMGVKRIVIVNDIDWFGGQWSCAGLTMIDEFAMYRGRRGLYPRSGTHLELIRYIRNRNRELFGKASPGNARAYQSTIPSIAAEAFEKLIEPYSERGTGQVRVFRGYQPVEVKVENNRVVGVVFEKCDDPTSRLIVNARETIDATDWGDVIRLSGASYFVGADPKSRFGEDGAPEEGESDCGAEMNSINFCPVLKEAGRDATIARPPNYDERLYFNSSRLTQKELDQLGFSEEVIVGKALPFVDTVPLGGYTIPGVDNTYAHRRLVDRRHNQLTGGVDTVVICRPPQDYPLYMFPKALADELEADEAGASQKSIVNMSYRQRQIVYEHAKQYYLGYVYFLQTTAHDKMGDYPESYRYMELSDEFGTADKMPPKPYIREGLRLHALYMARRGDYDSGIPMGSADAGWDFSKTAFPDAVFSWQCWFDFHPTRRVFLNGDTSQPWAVAAKKDFTATETNRGGFPLRGLVPVTLDGLVGSFLNIGHSSLVSSGLRWHATMPAVGQASAALAAIALREDVQPRDVCRNFRMVRDVQKNLVKPPGGAPGVALCAYQDLSPDVDSDRLFEAANFLAVRGILPPKLGTLEFEPYAVISRRELARALARAARSIDGAKSYYHGRAPMFFDVPVDDPDRVYIESLMKWGAAAGGSRFWPDRPADWPTMHAWMSVLGFKPNAGLIIQNYRMDGSPEERKYQLWRWDLAVHLWDGIKDLPEFYPEGTLGLNDPLPFDRDNDGLPDRLDPALV
jgi:hypothetical protein